MNGNNKDRTTQIGSRRRNDTNTLRDMFVQHTLAVVGIVTAVVVGLWLLWYAVDVLLLIFGGILVAVFLYSLSSWLSDHTEIPYQWSLGIVVLSILVITGLVVWFAAPRIVQEATQLAQQIPRSIDQIRQVIAQYPGGQMILEWLPPLGQLVPSQSNILARITGIFSNLFNVLAGLVLMIFVGLYLALNPGLYEQGIVKLIPMSKRPQAREVLSELGYTLRWWLVGRISSMVIIGVLITAGLWLIGMPFAFVLGLLAGLLEYIPNIGPILAAVPALLIAFTQGQTQVLYVAGLYAAVQALESYVITPLILKQAVSLPPAVTISVVVLFGVLFGFLGLLMATPLAAVLLVLIKKLYVEDLLGDTSVHVHGEQKAKEQVKEQDQAVSG